MLFLRNLIPKQWLKQSKHQLFVGIIAAIATSMLLLIAWLAPSTAQVLKPFSGTPAPKAAYLDRIISLVDQDRDRLVTIFKDIHQNPELGFMETRTSAIVAKELQALGYEVKTGIGKTGVVGILRNGNGPKVMFRADMDANVNQRQVIPL